MSEIRTSNMHRRNAAHKEVSDGALLAYASREGATNARYTAFLAERRHSRNISGPKIWKMRRATAWRHIAPSNAIAKKPTYATLMNRLAILCARWLKSSAVAMVDRCPLRPSPGYATARPTPRRCLIGGGRQWWKGGDIQHPFSKYRCRFRHGQRLRRRKRKGIISAPVLYAGLYYIALRW